jgi:hypothetical protein
MDKVPQEIRTSEPLYLGKKISELNTHELRFMRLMQLMLLDRMLKSAKITHKPMPESGSF